ncbi:MAG: M24 family metallopeptidase [Chitinivibrionales bacterium]|nr:M24 family metallopeptidase [Chitinivibrionales bacterium]
MKSRLSQLKSLLKKSNCTHILVTDIVDVRYFSGFRSTQAFLLVSKSDNYLISDFRYKEAGKEHCAQTGEWEFFEYNKSGFGFLAEIAPPSSRIGIQSNIVTLDQFDDLKRQCNKCIFVKLSTTVSSLCIPKFSSEITAMASAARIGDRALKSVLPRLKTGITEKEAAAELEALCARFGSEKPSFDTIVLFGARSALPHGQPSSAQLRKGDWILVDFGCTVDGFCSDMTRTMVYGKAGPKQKEIYAVVLKARKNARTHARAGITAAGLDRHARSIIKDHGFGDYFGHGTGHGVGLRIHEAPRVASAVKSRLPANAVVTIEPGIYLPDFGGVRIEDMILLEKNGNRVLTHSPRRLLELGV